MDNSADVRLLLASRYPLVLAEERDEPRFLEMIKAAAAGLGLPVWTWSATQGLARDGCDAQYGTQDPGKALALVSQLPDPAVFVFLDVHSELSNPVLVRQVKEQAQAGKPGQTLVFCDAELDAPAELDGLVVSWKLRPPDRAELDRLVRTTIGRLQQRGLAVALDDAGVAGLVDALSGLSATEADRAIQREAMKDGRLDSGDIPDVRVAKAELLQMDGPLELVDTAGSLDAVGGMARLKDWLRLRGKAMEPGAASAGLDPPRGVLLTGVPGCGKSLVAKTLAGTWGMPLILLDPSRLYGPYVGQSEKRLEDSLSAVDAMAPVVLWIDEIEKGFAAGGTDDGGVGERVLGTFLRWMQDRPSGVFVVATANQVKSLPPEFLRKGRFDQIFFVDLPGADEREEIFRLHLVKRHRDPAAFDLPKLAAASDGFSGAEIEAAVAGALYRAFAAGRDLSTDDILNEIQASPPLSRTRAEDVAGLRAWAQGRAVPV